MAKRKKTGKGWKRRVFNRGLIPKVLVVVFIGAVIYSLVLYLGTQSSNANEGLPRKAVIIDQLSLTYPNQTFIKRATSILQDAEFTVDYYPGEEVDVSFYQNLPSRGYGIIILRVHSGPVVDENNIAKSYISFFTSENYSINKYQSDQILGRLVPVEYYNGSPIYFAVTPDFFRYKANGRFNNSVIVMMGCVGLTFGKMADTLVYLGAKVYVSWDRPVLAEHTDLGTINFLKHFVTEKKTIGLSIFETKEEVGPDPQYDAYLLFYPVNEKTRDFALPESSLIINTTPNNIQYAGRDPRKALSFIH